MPFKSDYEFDNHAVIWQCHKNSIYFLNKKYPFFNPVSPFEPYAMWMGTEAFLEKQGALTY